MGLITLLMPTIAFAVGLGNIRIHSALNQRLSAQVPIVDLGNVAMDSVNVQLASVDQFKLVGLDRDPNLSKLRFKILRSAQGQAYVQIITTAPISEPVMTFLVNLTWPNGQMMREYTVFLDPISYSKTSTKKFKPATARTKQTAKAKPIKAQDTYGPTTSTDDLWAIAKKTRKPGTSIQQNMVAIFKKNQNAFLRNNINGLKSGQTLTLPKQSEVKGISTTKAINYLKQQDKAWHQQKTKTKQHPVDTLPEDLQAKKQSSTININQAPEEFNLVPENELKNEGDQYQQDDAQNQFLPQTSTEKALGTESQASQENTSKTNKMLTNEVVKLQKQLIAKDREILTLEKLLSEKSPDSPTQIEQHSIDSPTTTQTTQSAPQAGEIDIEYGLPWYTFPLLILIVFGSLIAGVYIQKRRMRGSMPEGEREKPIDVKSLTDKPFDDSVSKAQETQVIDETTPHKEKPLDISQTLVKAEELINQGAYQEAIDELIKLQQKEGKQFEIGIKLLEVFGLAEQKNNFIKCKNNLISTELTMTQKNILDAVINMFPDYTTKENQQVSEDELSEESTYHEAPVAFDLQKTADENEVVSLDDAEEKTKTNDSEADTKSEEASNVIDFEAGLNEQLSEEPREETSEKADIDEAVWDKMLQNLSVETEEEAKTSTKEKSVSQDSEKDSTNDISEQSDEPSSLPEKDSVKIPKKNDELDTQIDLAKAYIEMGDTEEAKEILQHIIEHGNEAQIQTAKELLERI